MALLSLENIEGTPSDLDTTAQLEVLEDTTAAIAQAETDAAGAEEAAKDIAAGNAATDTLDTLVEDVVAPSLEAGGEGLSEDTGEAVAIAVESIRNSLEFGDYKRVTPAKEQFGNSGSRIYATKMVVESIGDTIKSIWVAIKAALKRLLDKARSMFVALTTSTSGLISYIDTLTQRARALPANSKPVEKNIEHAGVATVLAVKGQSGIAAFNTLDANVGKLGKASKRFADTVKAIAAKNSELAAKSEITDADIAAYHKGKGGLVDQAAEALNGMAQMDFAGMSPSGMKLPKNTDDKSAVKYFGPFPGNTVLRLTAKTLVVGGEEGATVELNFTSGPKVEKEKLPALDQAGVLEILGRSKALAFSLKDYEAVKSVSDSTVKDLNTTADKLIGNAEKLLEASGAKSASKAALRELRADAASMIATLNTVTSAAPIAQFRLAKAGADYASISLRNIRPS